MKSNTPDNTARAGLMIGYAKVAETVTTGFFTILVLGFYMAHYFWSTGFFTNGFTPLLAGIFFASVLSTIATASTKAMTPRKDIVALVEFVGAGLLALAAYWFYQAFPLDFTHVADVVPAQLQFLLTWITNDIGRIIVTLALIASIIALAVDAVRLSWRVSERQYRKLERP